MGRTISFFVPGTPAPQGSKRHVGKGIMVESCKHLKPWRSDVRSMAMDHLTPDWDRTLPMEVYLEFRFLRPKNHFTGKGGFTKRAPSFYVLSKNDADKLARAVLDALTSVAWDDDGQVFRLVSERRYCYLGEQEGVKIAAIGYDNCYARDAWVVP